MTTYRISSTTGIELDRIEAPISIRQSVRAQIEGRAREAARKQHERNHWRLDCHRDGSLSWQESVSRGEATIDSQAEGFAAIPTLATVANGCRCDCSWCADGVEYADRDTDWDAIEYYEREMEQALAEIPVGYFADEDERRDAYSLWCAECGAESEPIETPEGAAE